MTQQRTQLIDRELIVIDPDVQPRETIDMETVEQYREDKKRGDEFPPAIVFFDGERYWPGDGIHRILAEPEGNQIPAIVKEGGRHEARLHACGANRTHGLKRSQADKRRAIRMALEEMPEATDRAIAEHVGVSHHTVATLRGENPPPSRDRNGQVGNCPPDGADEHECDPESSGAHLRTSEETGEGELVYDASESQVEPQRRKGLDGKTYKVPPKKPLPQPSQQRTFPSAQPTPPPKDDNGTEAAPDLEAVFQSVPLFNAALAACHRAVNALQAVESSTAYRFLDDYYRQLYQTTGGKEGERHVYSTSVLCAVRNLKSFRPALVCDACTPVERANRGGSKCKKCSGKGWLSGEDIES
jgi:hypothetical protein